MFKNGKKKIIYFFRLANLSLYHIMISFMNALWNWRSRNLIQKYSEAFSSYCRADCWICL